VLVAALAIVATSTHCCGGSVKLSPSPSVSSGEPRTPPTRTARPSLDAADRSEKAATIMRAFAERSGITGRGPGVRYLWTDAFAVCNFLGLARFTGKGEYQELALQLVNRVHHTLGRHRPDDARSGWISGLDERAGELHPTAGGLRIGKSLPERAPGEPFNAQLEWERDGQYFHYLTKWMHALDQAARSTGQPLFNVWGRELADTAHRGFVYRADGGTRRRMYWKMNVDLSRPLVPSMGLHDALDGFITSAELRASARAWPGAGGPGLEDVTADFDAMIDPESFETADPLGIGGLLTDAYRVAQLEEAGTVARPGLTERLLEASLAGVMEYVRQGDLQQSAERRLAFRELGLAIGLDAVTAMHREAGANGGGTQVRRALVEELVRHGAVGARIVAFWADPEHQAARSWTEHRDINEVMLATALAPDGFLVLRAGTAR
jgi:hypothetical protein